MRFNFETEKLIKELKERKPSKVLVQLPEGIKQTALDVQKIFEDLEIEVVFSGETCWGACSISVIEAECIGADLIVHFGHAQFIPSKFPILYIEVIDEEDLTPLIKESFEMVKDYQTLGLSYSIQHKHEIEKITKLYEDQGKKIILSEKKGHAAYTGHVVGCEFTGLKTIQEEVDAFIILGNNFHSMGASLAVEKPVILIDLYNQKVTEMKGVRDKILRQRIMSIDKFRQAKRVGVLMEIKPGQKFGSAKFITRKLKAAGKEVIVISISEMTPDKLMNFYSIEAFVELGCPRIAIDDFAKYHRTIITYKEALVAIGEKTLEETIKSGLI